ncbi:MAG: hypothetical protein ACXWPS_16425 [Ktedonobacteraceae bacterium]
MAGEWVPVGETQTNQSTALRFDTWRANLTLQLTLPSTLSETERECLTHFLKTSESLRPRLIRCYDVKGLPRTTHDMEGSIRKLKTRYRRISGRKNWNAYLLRYGQCIASYDWVAKTIPDDAELLLLLSRVDRHQWQQLRAQSRQSHGTRVKVHRFRHKRQEYLRHLEERWSDSFTQT